MSDSALGITDKPANSEGLAGQYRDELIAGFPGLESYFDGLGLADWLVLRANSQARNVFLAHHLYQEMTELWEDERTQEPRFFELSERFREITKRNSWDYEYTQRELKLDFLLRFQTFKNAVIQMFINGADVEEIVRFISDKEVVVNGANYIVNYDRSGTLSTILVELVTNSILAGGSRINVGVLPYGLNFEKQLIGLDINALNLPFKPEHIPSLPKEIILFVSVWDDVLHSTADATRIVTNLNRSHPMSSNGRQKGAGFAGSRSSLEKRGGNLHAVSYPGQKFLGERKYRVGVYGYVPVDSLR